MEQPDWAQPQGTASLGVAHSKFVPAPKVGGFPPPPPAGGPPGAPPVNVGGGQPTVVPPPQDNTPPPKGPPPQMAQSSKASPPGWPPGPLQPPSGSLQLSPPSGPLHPPGGAPSPQGMQSSATMQQLLNMQSDAAQQTPSSGMQSGMQSGMGTSPSPTFQHRGMMPNFNTHPNGMGLSSMGPIRPSMNNSFGQHRPTPPLGNSFLNWQQGPGPMVQQDGDRPRGMMQPNFRPPGGMMQQNFNQQNMQQQNFNHQFGNSRPPNHMQQNLMQPNHMQQNLMQPNQMRPPTMLQQAAQQLGGLGQAGIATPGYLQPGLQGMQGLGQTMPPPGAALQPGVGGPRLMTHAQARATPPPPPPSPPPEDPGALGRTNSGPQIKERSKNQGPEFGKRFMQLRKEHPEVEVPSDMFTYSLADLEAYFASKAGQKAGAAAPQTGEKGAPEVERPVSAPEQQRKSPTSTRKRKAVGPPPEEELQYSVEEALDLQAELSEGFGDRSFQDELRDLQTRYPDRKKKGHKDMPAYFEAFQSLTLGVFAAVLPKIKLEANWDGVREMLSRMDDALKHPKVKKAQEDINVLMGLPRNAIFQPPKKDEELFVFRPDSDGPVPGFTRPTVVDEDGDEAHEFFVEDPQTGELRIRGPSACEDADCWYLVLHKPAVVLRSKPDVKAEMVGRKKNGKRVRVQRVVDNTWAQLHPAELARLGVREAWAPLDGTVMGVPGQLMEREI